MMHKGDTGSFLHFSRFLSLFAQTEFSHRGTFLAPGASLD